MIANTIIQAKNPIFTSNEFDSDGEIKLSTTQKAESALSQSLTEGEQQNSSDSDLKGIENDLNNKINSLNRKLKKLRGRLQTTKQNRERLKHQLLEAQTQKNEYMASIEAMRMSKVWKTHEKYVSLKQKVNRLIGRRTGLSGETLGDQSESKDSKSGMNSGPLPLSPLTRNQNVTLLESFETKKLIQDWKNSFGIDISSDLKANQFIHLYNCNQTGLKFFIPESVVGSDLLYAELEKFDWYYMKDKWEYEVALNDIRDDKCILEVGSGYGYFVEKCQNRGLDISGVELNGQAVKVAQGNNLPVHLTTLESLLETSRECFDVVCSFQVLEHVPDPASFLQMSLDLIKPGGALILCVPNPDSFLKHEYCLLDMPPHHMHRWSLKTFESLQKIFPVTLESFRYEPLADYHIGGYLTAYSDYYRSQYFWGSILFNQYSLPAYRIMLING